MTWVIDMSMSSTTLARTNSGAPLAFTSHEVVHGRTGELDDAPDDVVHDGDSFVGRAEPQGHPFAPGQVRGRQNPS